MQYNTKTKIAVGIGIGLIIAVVSLVGLPFMNAEAGIEKIPQQNIQKVEDAEEKLLRIIMHEKAEIELKTGKSP